MTSALAGATPLVAVVGSANIDIRGKPATDLQQHASNPGTVQISAGGVARNIAANLRRLGIDARLFAAIGDDLHGRMLTSLCQQAALDTDYLQTLPGACTAAYVSILDGCGDLNVAVADTAITERIDAKVLDQHRALFDQASVIVLDTNLSAQALEWVVTTFVDTPIFVDTVSPAKAARIRGVLESIHTLKASEKEAARLAGFPAASQPSMARVAAKLRSMGLKRAFVTRGAHGAYYWGPDASGRASRVGKHAICSTEGAGDAYAAALVYSWLTGLTVQQTLAFADAAAAITMGAMAASSQALSVARILRYLEKSRDS